MKKTPWFSVSWPPVRKGEYEWRCDGLSGVPEGLTLVWRGDAWRGTREWGGLCPACEWRGLAKQP